MQKLKLAIFLPSSAGGGAERAMITLASALAERGFKVDLVLGKHAGEFSQQIPPSIRVLEFGHERVSRSLIYLVRYINAESPDILVSVMAHTNCVAVIATSIASHKPSLVLTDHLTWSMILKHESFKDKLLLAVARLLYPKADAIVAVSKGAAVDLARFMNFSPRNNKIVWIYNPVVTSEL